MHWPEKASDESSLVIRQSKPPSRPPTHGEENKLNDAGVLVFLQFGCAAR